MKKFLFTGSLLLFFSTISFAGELSNFEIIGFNDDMTYLSFAEYGINSKFQSYASIYIVDLVQNDFVNNGIFTKTYKANNSLEKGGVNALYDQLINYGSKIKQYNINPLNTGRLIYILLDGADQGNYLQFTDYKTKYVYSINLNQDRKEIGTRGSSSFYLELEIKDGTKAASYIVGQRNFYRENVDAYKIRSIYTTLNDSALVFVIEKLFYDSDGELNIHFMVETIKWR